MLESNKNLKVKYCLIKLPKVVILSIIIFFFSISLIKALPRIVGVTISNVIIESTLKEAKEAGVFKLPSSLPDGYLLDRIYVKELGKEFEEYKNLYDLPSSLEEILAKTDELKLICDNNNKKITCYIHIEDEVNGGFIKSSEGTKIGILDDGYYFSEDKEKIQLIKFFMFLSTAYMDRSNLPSRYIIYEFSTRKIDGATMKELITIGKSIN